MLVAVGAAVFVDMANRLHGHENALHMVSGIGFLGAGVIMREEGNACGLNTAATLWGSAAVGACAGADLVLEAFLGASFILAANTLLRPVVHAINREPLDLSAEATSVVYVIAHCEHRKEVLSLLEVELNVSDYPTQDLTMHAFGNDEVEIEAILAATSVDRRRWILLSSSLPPHH